VDEVADEDGDQKEDEAEPDDRERAGARPGEERRERRWGFSAGLDCDG
jgi:hypothetical protein